jgi:hypothetical protein
LAFCDFSLPIYEATLTPASVVAAVDKASQSGHVWSVEPDKSILDVVLAVEEVPIRILTGSQNLRKLL